MLNKKEILSILGVTFVLGIIISLIETWEIFGITLGLIFAVILTNVIFKKVTAFYIDTDVEINTWEWSRFGYKKHHHFRKPVPGGILIPLLVKFFSVGLINWMACLTFEVRGKTYRSAKRHGIYSFSEVSEKEMGWIASAGIWANIILAIIGYLIGTDIFLQFAKLNLIYAFFNIIPISNLDGSKIFFGNKINWMFLAILTSIAVLGTLMIV